MDSDQTTSGFCPLAARWVVHQMSCARAGRIRGRSHPAAVGGCSHPGGLSGGRWSHPGVVRRRLVRLRAATSSRRCCWSRFWATTPTLRCSYRDNSGTTSWSGSPRKRQLRDDLAVRRPGPTPTGAGQATSEAATALTALHPAAAPHARPGERHDGSSGTSLRSWAGLRRLPRPSRSRHRQHPACAAPGRPLQAPGPL